MPVSALIISAQDFRLDADELEGLVFAWKIPWTACRFII
jgi:hypothetical protein